MNDHPVTLHVMDDLRRSRLTVFFRFLLCVPHFIWLYIWGALVGIVFILNWFVALIIGRPAKPFQRFTAAFLRYATTVGAYLLLTANPFPGFTGEPGSYPVELEVPTTPEKQSRLKTFFRFLLVFPAIVVAELTMLIVYIFYPLLGFAWWAALITGRMPRGFRDLGANALRYFGQIYSYVLLVTGVYPCSSPYVGIEFGEPVAVAAPAAVEKPVKAEEAPAAADTPEAPEAPSKK